MDAAGRIVQEFNRLVELDRAGIRSSSLKDQFVYYVVAVRCEIDMNGFADVFVQCLEPAEVGIFLAALDTLEERPLADGFRRAFECVRRDGFYDHRDWSRLSPATLVQLELTRDRVGDRLWELDGKLVALLDDPAIGICTS